MGVFSKGNPMDNDDKDCICSYTYKPGFSVTMLTC